MLGSVSMDEDGETNEVVGLVNETHPPTGVEHSIFCNLMNSHEQQLVVSSANFLQIYKILYNPECPTKPDKDARGKSVMLELLYEQSLFGRIEAIASASILPGNRDALLLAFKDAKLSVLEWSQSSYELQTVSMHYFEEDEFKEGVTRPTCIPLLRVDTENRCACMLIYNSYVVVIPFRRASNPDSRVPVLSSYTMNLKLLDERVHNVLDMQFLHGYNEPTLLVLYEPNRTWSGRIQVLRDTCCIAAISLNTQKRVHPIIWQVSSLPYDCLSAVAIPKPIGGVVILAVNSVLYMNQSTPSYGVALNEIAAETTDFPLKQQNEVLLTLDASLHSFLSNEALLLSLKGGELYIMTLLTDDMRIVRNLNFAKSGSTVLSTSMCVYGDLLFLGSRLANSVLLQYTQRVTDSTPQPPAAKRARIDSDIDGVDELDEFYGTMTSSSTSSHVKSYSLEVRDTLVNIGPCGRMCLGETTMLADEFQGSVDPDLELVTTSGHGKNGALTVLQRSVRPQVVSTFELGGVTNMWTLLPPGGDSQQHAYLLLTKDQNTTVLATGSEISEVDESGFSTIEPTLLASNIGSPPLSVQITLNSLVLLSGITRLQLVDLPSPVLQASVAGHFVLILTSGGDVFVYRLEGKQLSHLYTKQSQVGKLQCLCVYADYSGLFVTTPDSDPETQATEPQQHTSPLKSANNSLLFDLPDEEEDEDALLYGEAPAPQQTDTQTTSQPAPDANSGARRKRPETSTLWVCLVSDTGLMEIRALPSWEQVYVIKNFPQGFGLLYDCGEDLQLKVSGTNLMERAPPDNPAVLEVLLTGQGSWRSRPLLLIRTAGDLYVYEVFALHSSDSAGRLQIRFRKLPHQMLLRKTKAGAVGKNAPTDDDADDILDVKYNTQQLIPYTGVAGYSGVFVAGDYPYWLVMGSRGALRCHPMSVDGHVTCFSPFNNVNCTDGFLYFNNQNELRIAVLPKSLQYENHWPSRRVGLRATPHFVVYHSDSKTYAVVTSSPEPCKKVMRINQDEKEVEPQIRGDRFLFPNVDVFSVQLYSPNNWEIIPHTEQKMDEWEHVTCGCHVTLNSEETHSGLKGYIAFGTNVCYGEDVTVRGRILLYDVTEVVPEPGQPLTKNKLKSIYDKEQKGPVTSLCAVRGYLLSAIGQKIYMWTLLKGELSGVAFLDTQLYVHQTLSVKNLVLCGDVCKSVFLLRFQDKLRVLSFVAKDCRPMNVYGLEYIVDDRILAFLACDKEQNLTVFMHRPQDVNSKSGQYLVRTGDFHLGAHVHSMLRVRARQWDPALDARMDSTASDRIQHRHVTYYSTLDGAQGYFVALSERLYRALLMVQQSLQQHLSHTAGLNPKAFREVKYGGRSVLHTPQRRVLDGTLIFKYLHLSRPERLEIARRTGFAMDILTNYLTMINRWTAHF